MNLEKFRGVSTASVTPMNEYGEVDLGSVAALTEYYIESGLKGAFFPSSSGEYFALTARQRVACVRAAVRAAEGRLTVFSNISESSLGAAIENAKAMAGEGADCAVLMPPSFHHHTQEELIGFFRRAADASPLPLVVYAHLTRLPNKIEIPAVLELSAHPNIIGIKDTHNDAARLMTLNQRLHGRDDFLAFAGGDGMAGFSALFGMEMLNALSAIRPDIFIALYDAGHRGDLAAVSALQQRVNRLSGLFTALHGGQSSASLFSQALKTALSLKGLCGVDAVQMGFPVTSQDIAKVKEVLDAV